MAQLWASISIALVLVTLILIIAYERSHLLSALVFAIAVFAFIEAGFRRRLTRFIVSVNVALAVVGALVLLEHYFWSVIVLAVLGSRALHPVGEPAGARTVAAETGRENQGGPNIVQASSTTSDRVLLIRRDSYGVLLSQLRLSP